jgi:hypothetical protein
MHAAAGQDVARARAKQHVAREVAEGMVSGMQGLQQQQEVQLASSAGREAQLRATVSAYREEMAALKAVRTHARTHSNLKHLPPDTHAPAQLTRPLN